MLGPDDLVLQKYLQPMHFRELVDLQKSEKQDHHIHLTMELLYDMQQKYEFFPFIY